ncbi:hypothetical protein KY320_04385 [Candidatus Woesearchaeota archaeon]|nr:hypothetical protein [Candidatus Woesearchaeota archaeon]
MKRVLFLTSKNFSRWGASVIPQLQAAFADYEIMHAVEPEINPETLSADLVFMYDKIDGENRDISTALLERRIPLVMLCLGSLTSMEVINDYLQRGVTAYMEVSFVPRPYVDYITDILGFPQ